MKRLFFPLVAVLTALTACNNGAESTYQTLGFSPVDNGIRLYADQALDTTYRVAATSDWTLTSDAPWLTTAPNSGTVPQGKLVYQLLTLRLTPNTTDSVRTGQLALRSSLGVTTKPLYQLPILHLPKNEPVTERNSIIYAKVVSADTTSNATSLALRLYTTTAKVRSEASWIKVDTTAVYNVGDTLVPVTLDRNLEGARHGYITFYTPSGITTKVRFQQASQK